MTPEDLKKLYDDNNINFGLDMEVLAVVANNSSKTYG
jgi:hypothetical protein